MPQEVSRPRSVRSDRSLRSFPGVIPVLPPSIPWSRRLSFPARLIPAIPGHKHGGQKGTVVIYIPIHTYISFSLFFFGNSGFKQDLNSHFWGFWSQSPLAFLPLLSYLGFFVDLDLGWRLEGPQDLARDRGSSHGISGKGFPPQTFPQAPSFGTGGILPNQPPRRGHTIPVLQDLGSSDTGMCLKVTRTGKSGNLSRKNPIPAVHVELWDVARPQGLGRGWEGPEKLLLTDGTGQDLGEKGSFSSIRFRLFPDPPLCPLLEFHPESRLRHG